MNVLATVVIRQLTLYVAQGQKHYCYFYVINHVLFDHHLCAAIGESD